MINPLNPTTEYIAARGVWVVKTAIDFDLVDYPKFTVPVGFESDGASVPRFLWSLMPPISSYTQAAFGHDYLYKEHDPMRDRKQADKFFRDAMVFLGVGLLKRNTMYRAVRLFGRGAWK